jgi:hypothetical protein
MNTNLPANLSVLTNGKDELIVRNEQGQYLRIFIASASSHYHRARLMPSELVDSFSSNDFYSTPTLVDCIKNATKVVFEWPSVTIKTQWGNLNIEVKESSIKTLNCFLSGEQTAKSELTFANVINKKYIDPNGVTGIGPNNPVIAFVAA